MKHYVNVVQNQVGLPVSGASVTINVNGGGLATIYSDDGITITTNPVVTDALGRFDFFVADGRYDLIVSGAGIASPFTISNVEIADLTEESSGDLDWIVNSLGLQIGSVPNTISIAAGASAPRTATLPDNTGVLAETNFSQTWTAPQTFSVNDLVLAGSTSGNTILNASAVASGTIVVPAANDTLVARATTDNLTNKTITVSSNTINNSSNLAGHVLRNNGTQYVDSLLNFTDLVVSTTGTGAVVLQGSPTINTPTISTIINSGTLTLPTLTDTLIGRATTDTLTNKTLTSPILTTPVINGASTGTGVQGTDTKLLTSGTVSGTGSTLCLDANGGATTSGCNVTGIIQHVTYCASGCDVTGTPCTTGNNSYDRCSNTISWPSSFSNTNYTVTCSGVGPNDGSNPSNPGRAYLQIISKAVGSISVDTVTTGASAISWSEIDCIGVHS